MIAYCEQRVPPHALHQVRMEAVVDRHAVTLVERRAPWRPEFGPERDRNHGWQRYEYSRPTTEIAALLEEIDRDPTGIFWG